MMPDISQMAFRRIKRKTTIFILVVFIYNTFGFLLIQPLFSSYPEHFDTIIQEEMSSLIHFYCFSYEPSNALEEDLQYDENSLNKKERSSDNSQFNTGYSEPVCCLTPEKINFPGSIFINNTSVYYLYIFRDIPTLPPQLI